MERGNAQAPPGYFSQPSGTTKLESHGTRLSPQQFRLETTLLLIFVRLGSRMHPFQGPIHCDRNTGQDCTATSLSGIVPQRFFDGMGVEFQSMV